MQFKKLLQTMILALALIGPAVATSLQESAAGEPSAAGVAVEFLESFAKKDGQAVRALFAPGALVQRARLDSRGGADLAKFEAGAWADQSLSNIAAIEDFKIEVLETSTLEFDGATTVSVRFKASGHFGEHYFVNDGVDTFSMTKTDRGWRILLYSSIEYLRGR